MDTHVSYVCALRLCKSSFYGGFGAQKAPFRLHEENHLILNFVG